MKKLSIFILLFSLCALSIRPASNSTTLSGSELSDEAITASILAGMLGAWSLYKAGKYFFKSQIHTDVDAVSLQSGGVSDICGDPICDMIKGSEDNDSGVVDGQQRTSNRQNVRPQTYVLHRDLLPAAFYGMIASGCFLVSLALVSA